MKKSMILTILFMANSFVFAKTKSVTETKQGFRKPASVECPAQFGIEDYQEKVDKAISSSSSCYEAKAFAESCAMGSSIDLQIGHSAEKKCANDFLRKLSKVDKDIYQKLLKKCDEKYEKMQGTMYMSASAFCRLDVAALFSNLYTSAE